MKGQTKMTTNQIQADDQAQAQPAAEAQTQAQPASTAPITTTASEAPAKKGSSKKKDQTQAQPASTEGTAEPKKRGRVAAEKPTWDDTTPDNTKFFMGGRTRTVASLRAMEGKDVIEDAMNNIRVKLFSFHKLDAKKLGKLIEEAQDLFDKYPKTPGRRGRPVDYLASILQAARAYLATVQKDHPVLASEPEFLALK